MRISDRQLLDRLAAGDEEAFTLLFLRHRRWLEARARRWLAGSGRDADDVLQDVYMRASAQLLKGAVPQSLEAWLSTLVRNACMDEQRSARVRVRRHAEEGTLATVAGGPEPLERVVAREQLTSLVEDVSRLPARQRRVLELSLEGASHQDIADRLDCTVLTTRSLLMRARENLRLSADARQTPCGDIRRALDHAARRRRRAPELVRRHLWSCSACERYGERTRRRQSAAIRERVAVLSPAAVVGQLLGGFGVSGGAAAGGGGAAGKLLVGTCCAMVLVGGDELRPVDERPGRSDRAQVSAEHARPAERARSKAGDPDQIVAATPAASASRPTVASGGLGRRGTLAAVNRGRRERRPIAGTSRLRDLMPRASASAARVSARPLVQIRPEASSTRAPVPAPPPEPSPPVAAPAPEPTPPTVPVEPSAPPPATPPAEPPPPPPTTTPPIDPPPPPPTTTPTPEPATHALARRPATPSGRARSVR